MSDERRKQLLREKVRDHMLQLGTIAKSSDDGVRYVVSASLSMLSSILASIEKEDADALREFITRNLSEKAIEDFKKMGD